jgi:hypothetical protein
MINEPKEPKFTGEQMTRAQQVSDLLPLHSSLDSVKALLLPSLQFLSTKWNQNACRNGLVIS